MPEQREHLGEGVATEGDPGGERPPPSGEGVARGVPVPRSPHPAADLRTALEWAIEREGPLFSAGELVVLRRMLALGADAAELYARLTLRVGLVYADARLAYAAATPVAIAELVDAGLVSRAVPDDWAFGAFPADTLRDACRRAGLSRGGSRAELEARLAGRRWREEAVFLVLQRELLDRVGRLGGFDRALAPVERIVGCRWAPYIPTGGPGAFRTRGAMLTFERARRGEWAPGEALAVARAGPPAWGRSPWRYAVEAVLSASPPADDLRGVPGCAVAWVRALEAEGRIPEALSRCREGDADPEVALALSRTGRRLARALKAPWPPAEPPAAARGRTIWLRRAASAGARPLWRAEGAEEGLPVEAAVAAHLVAHGRRAIHAENWLWTSFFALVFRELYWADLPGRLPTPRRSGPLDLGFPEFFLARRNAALSALDRLRTAGLAPFAAAWHGERLDGLIRAETSIEIGLLLPGEMIAAALWPLLEAGWSAARGLPDLVVLPGGETRLADAIPGILPDMAFFAEIKGPGDTLRDGQRLWHDRLVKAGQIVELWEVTNR